MYYTYTLQCMLLALCVHYPLPKQACCPLLDLHDWCVHHDCLWHLQVKLRGFRIELTEIEHHLSSFKGIQQVIVAVLQDSMGQQHLVAYVSPAQTDIHQLNAHAARVLPKHMIPETFVPLDEFPTLPNGKVDRNSLPKPQYEHMAEADYVAPSSPLEEQVRGLSST